jgi:hypothetical protein
MWISVTIFWCLQHNKRRTELHRLQAKHPELAARMERQQARAAAHEDEDASDSESKSSSDSESEVCVFRATCTHRTPGKRMRHAQTFPPPNGQAVSGWLSVAVN